MHKVWMSMWMVLGLVGCKQSGEQGATSALAPMKDVSRVSQEAPFDYPFAVGFGASWEDLMRAEGMQEADNGNNFIAIYTYDRSWHGYAGALNYLYLAEDDAVIAVSFDIAMTEGVALEEILALAERLYQRATPELYEAIFALEAGKGAEILHDEASGYFFFSDIYAIHINPEPDHQLISIVYSYACSCDER
ncbi:hypothetical protein [Entomospira culicis]|uniref:Uncharacterized protein n=1 Tax=Entomospira culicis TaxID=2719989 RepID=A0A968KW11_9SPIO|nr:hypothetical protein [Entomospira culicis]NIZ19367.1 hypothetical protein [Entomospira culicis]NIZ69728.1 hypothetical protein [Entomospira culicis]WDI36839.1 hypothetical protein PVA46_05805 [Entomospira culicis]WDI38468.1 hypothetical protein PVA47_05815 [Entomospira culicis]